MSSFFSCFLMLMFSFSFFWISVASQKFETGTSDAYVIVGNVALLKCEIPSFVSDFVLVNNWVDNEGQEYFSSGAYGIIQLSKNAVISIIIETGGHTSY